MVSLHDIFDKPLAGPEMRIKYETALGKFLVAFNAVENYLRYTVNEIVKSKDQSSLWHDDLSRDDFHRQLKNLRLLILAEPFFDDVPFDRLIALNKTRNRLAHGHYDQDLFSDKFEIVEKQRRTKITIAEIEEATTEAIAIWQEMGTSLANFVQHLHGNG